MATVAHNFTHFDRTHNKGDEIPDDDPLVTGAPHLFVQPPEPDPEPEPKEPVRHRGPLAEQPKKAKG